MSLDQNTQEPSVHCYDIRGQLVSVPQSTVQFRPAVYGLLIENKRVLLQKHPHTRLLQPIGGLVAPEQTIFQALRQHFHAATGLTPFIEDLIWVEEAYQLDQIAQAWHLSVLYHRLRRPTTGRSSLINFDNLAQPEWFNLENLDRTEFQFGYHALQMAANHLSLLKKA